MADKKITQLTNITGANLVDADEFVVVDISADETKAITLGELKEAFDSGSGFVRITGDTMTGDLGLSGADITFGDNDKAIFGAGSDLQIYHDGANSYIQNTVNSLIIQNDGDDKQVIIKSDNGSGGVADYFRANGITGEALLYHYGSSKLATTSTGIDVTGTVTADGLTVANTGVVAGDFDGGTAATYIRLQDDTDNFIFGTNNSLNSFLIKNETSDAVRLTIANNGDISFYEDTGTTAKFFWDASAESLGIGTSSPSAPLHVAGDARIGAGTGDASLMGMVASGDNFKITTSSSIGTVSFDRNVGIGTSSPSAGLDVFGNTTSTIRITGGGGGSDTARRATLSLLASGSKEYKVQASAADGSLQFLDSSTERMRIDSSGNLLVGTTDPLPNVNNVEGVAISSGSYGGFLAVSRDNATPMGINRKTSDGALLDFRKDGTTVGSIGTANGVPYFYGSSGFRLGGSIQPITSTGALSDNTTDIGQSNSRFKDLYLSGGVYLGGTGAANKLDSYESGSDSVSLRGSTDASTLLTATMYWVKINDQVSFQLGFEDVDTTGYAGSLFISGLPFANTSGSRAVVSVGSYRAASWTDNLIGLIATGGTEIEFMDTRSANTWLSANHSAGSGRYLWATGTYKN